MRIPILLCLALCACGPVRTDDKEVLAEICDNLEDDDLDELADCADPDCSTVCVEVCTNGTDDDLDGLTDCLDDDCDGLCPEQCADGRDNDGDGAIDCDDRDCFDSCPEVCGDGLDNDGDGKVDCEDEDCSDPACDEVCTDGRDNDGDGLTDCEDEDCSDPTCIENCTDGRDNDGDGRVDCDDDECAAVCDADGDGFVNADWGGDDCDDTRVEVNPSRPEICNGEEVLDDDCDGLFDEDDPDLDSLTLISWGRDLDGDGYGTTLDALRACQAPAGFGLADTDCDDARADIHPGMPEICNPDGPIDDDCDGLVDDADPDISPDSYLEWYADRDGDGFGVDDDVETACSRPDGRAATSDDCDDADPTVGPPSLWYPDDDGDGFGAGAPLAPVPSCDAPDDDARPDWSGLDCDDADPTAYPEAPEVCEDGVDQDCDGLDESCPCTDVRIALVSGFFTEPRFDDFLASVPSWSADRLWACPEVLLEDYDVLLVHGNPSCSYAAIDDWVSAGGAVIGTPWVLNNGYAEDLASLPVYPSARRLFLDSPLDVSVVDASDPILEDVVFVAGDIVGQEHALAARPGARASVRHNAYPEVTAVVSWEYGAGRAVYLDFQYDTWGSTVAVDYLWGQQLIANAISWAVCDSGPPDF